jgi:hypothetical protein
VYLIVHDRQVAEDVAQQAFAQLLIHWRKVSAYERPEAWVRRVAIRLAARTVKRERLRTTLHQQVEQQLPAPSPDVDLVRALKALPPRQRASINVEIESGTQGWSSGQPFCCPQGCAARERCRHRRDGAPDPSDPQSAGASAAGANYRRSSSRAQCATARAGHDPAGEALVSAR